MMLFKKSVHSSCALGNEPAYVALDNVSKSFATAKAVSQLTISVDKGEFFSLLGPSGCGKTTTLRLIAGLDRPDEGTIAINGQQVAAQNTWVQPEKRGVGIVFQDYALFPHMTITQNVGFGLAGCQRETAKERVDEMLDLTGLDGLGGRYPHELSGGQRQRVALARSLAPSPRVILLDEPFSNLDADLREELRGETKRILKAQGATTILVTHDQEEAFSLSDRVGVLNNGALEQNGTPMEIYHHPRSRFVADFVGMADFIDAEVKGEVVSSVFGTFQLNGSQTQTTGPVKLMIRPDDVGFSLDPAGEATIVEARFQGASILYLLQLDNGKAIHAIRPSSEIVPVGARARVTLDARHIVIFPKQ